MDDYDDEIDRRLLAIFWIFCSGVLFLAFAIGGYGLSAFATAVSIAAVFPSLAGFWSRYSLGGRKRIYLAVGAMALACFAYLVAPTASDDNGVEAESAGVVSDDEPESDGTQANELDSDPIAAAPEVTNCLAIDGDTLNCEGESIRLLGIDAPEMNGHCAPERNCAPGDPIVSKRVLSGVLQHSMKIVRVGEDQYQRTLAMVYAGNLNLSCYQLSNRQAVYVSDWDDGGRVQSACPEAIY